MHHEFLSATLLVISTKINEIYPPEVNKIIKQLHFNMKKTEVLQAEAYILEKLDYDVNPSETVYSELVRHTSTETEQLICEKNLKFYIKFYGLEKYGSRIMALSVIFMTRPVNRKQLNSTDSCKTKELVG